MRATSLALGTAFLLHPATALACSVCFDTTEENRAAYLGTTIFLSLLPLLAVFGVVYYVRGQLRAKWDREAAQSMKAFEEAQSPS